MELMLIVKVLLRRWWIVLLPIIIVAVWVLPDLLQTAPEGTGGYRVSFRYTAGQQIDAFPEREGDLQDVWESSVNVVDTFTEWVRTMRFKEAVAEVAAGRGVEFDANALSINSDNERVIGQVFIDWPNPDELQIIAESAVTVMQERNHEYFSAQLGGEPAQVTLLDAVQVSPLPPPITNRFEPLLRLALGVAAGVVLAFLVEYLDPTLHEREDLRRLGLPVVGSVPRER